MLMYAFLDLKNTISKIINNLVNPKFLSDETNSG
jgi:hypothetical protein